MAHNSEIKPYRIDIPQSDLDDLRQRLGRARWPDELPGVGWDRGRPARLPQGPRRLLGHDLRLARPGGCQLNEFAQFTTVIDDQNVHFLHVRSPEPGRSL